MKVALFAFQGDPMCFIHVLLNAHDLHERGNEAAIVFEGAACKLVPELAKPGPLHKLYAEAKEKGLIAGACKACSAKLGVLEAVEAEGLALLSDMSGHPSMAAFQDQGYRVITF